MANDGTAHPRTPASPTGLKLAAPVTPRGGENTTPTRRDVTRRDLTPRPPFASALRRPGAVSVESMPPRTAPSQPADVEQLLTVADVAAALRLDPYTVRRWIGRGQLPALRIGRELRVEPAALRAYLDDQAVTR